MSSTWTRPARPRPGSIHRPGLAAWKVAVAAAATAAPGDLAARGVDPARDVGREHRHAAGADRLDRLGDTPARRARRAGAEQRVDHQRRAGSDRRAGRQWLGSREPLEVRRGRRRRIRPARRRAARRPRARRRAGGALRPGRRRRCFPSRRTRRSGPRAPSSRPPQPARRRHAPSDRATALPARPMPSCRRRACARRPTVARATPPASSQDRHRGRHPARVGQRQADLDTELAGARPRRSVQRQPDVGSRREAPRRRAARTPRARAPWTPPPWRRSAPRGAGPADRGYRRTRARRRETTVARAPGRRSSARSIRSISSRSRPIPAARAMPTRLPDRPTSPSGHSTVTVLARLRGWSTFNPRRRAIE